MKKMKIKRSQLRAIVEEIINEADDNGWSKFAQKVKSTFRSPYYKVKQGKNKINVQYKVDGEIMDMSFTFDTEGNKEVNLDDSEGSSIEDFAQMSSDSQGGYGISPNKLVNAKSIWGYWAKQAPKEQDMEKF